MNVEGKVEVTGLSDVGRKRSHNEVSIGSDTSIGFVLADGMGGTSGEVAGAMAVNGLMETVREGLEWPGKWTTTPATPRIVLVKSAVEQANHEIHTTALKQPQCQGMGTTLVAAMFYDDRVTVPMWVTHAIDTEITVLNRLLSTTPCYGNWSTRGFIPRKKRSNR